MTVLRYGSAGWCDVMRCRSAVVLLMLVYQHLHYHIHQQHQHHCSISSGTCIIYDSDLLNRSV